MKTTFDIPEPLLREVQSLAKKRNTTTKSLVELALARLIEAERERAVFQLDDASVGGNGLTAEFVTAPWDRIRDEIYRGSNG
jgi:hypothetical protein